MKHNIQRAWLIDEIEASNRQIYW